MSNQPEALRLADGNDECAKAWLESSDAHKFRRDTAAELRRLHAEVTEWESRACNNLHKLNVAESQIAKLTHDLRLSRAAVRDHGNQIVADTALLAEMKADFQKALDALKAANETPNGPISDTIWMPGPSETLFDFMDAALSKLSIRLGV